jgi:hypothetical protein
MGGVRITCHFRNVMRIGAAGELMMHWPIASEGRNARQHGLLLLLTLPHIPPAQARV